MENCELFAELCSSYVEQELPVENRLEFEHHLNSCPACQEKVVAIEKLRKRLRNLQHIASSPDFETILRARIQMTKNVGRRNWLPVSPQIRWPAYGFAAVVLIFAITFFMQNRNARQRFMPTTQGVTKLASPDPISITKSNIFYSLDAVAFPQPGILQSESEQETSLNTSNKSPFEVDSTKDLAGGTKRQIKRHIRAVSF